MRCPSCGEVGSPIIRHLAWCSQRHLTPPQQQNIVDDATPLSIDYGAAEIAVAASEPSVFEEFSALETTE